MSGSDDEFEAFRAWKAAGRRRVPTAPAPPRQRLVLLGLGFGGMEALVQVQRELAKLDAAGRASWDVVVVERKQYWMGGLGNQYIMTGRRDEESCRRYYVNLRMWDVARWVQDEVVSIDVERRVVECHASGPLAYDHLIVALGVESQPVPLVKGHMLDFCCPDDAAQARSQLATLSSGTVLVAVARAPYKCPPAPFEIAFLVDDLLRRRGVRAQCRVVLTVPLPTAVPIECPDDVLALLRAKDIEFHAGVQPRTIDTAPDGRQVVSWMAHPKFNPDFLKLPDPGPIVADVLLGTWPQLPPAAMRVLCNESGFVPVDTFTLRTRHRDVYCLGDCAALELPSKPPKPHPKAGGFSEGQARVAVRNIFHGTGWDEPAPFRQDSTCAAVCAAETSLDSQLLISIDLHSVEGDPVYITSPCDAQFKDRWWAERCQRWFFE